MSVERFSRFPVLIFSETFSEWNVVQSFLSNRGLRFEYCSDLSGLHNKLDQNIYSILICDLVHLDHWKDVKMEWFRSFSDTMVVIVVLDTEDPLARNITADVLLRRYPTKVEMETVLQVGLELSQSRFHFYKSVNGDASNEIAKINEDSKGRFTVQKRSIYSLATSLSQGSGLGTSVSLIDMIEADSEIENGFYKVNAELMELLLENNQYSRKILEGMQNMVNLFEHEIVLSEYSINYVVQELPPYLYTIQEFLPSKKLNLEISATTMEGYVKIQKDKYFLMVEELVVNAFKYSVPDSKIEIHFERDSEFFRFSVRNQVDRIYYGGVPPELESLVTEPFIRIYPPGDENFRIVKFGLGLGLTAIEYIVNQHNGVFTIKDEIIGDADSPVNFVKAEIFLPIIEKGE